MPPDPLANLRPLHLPEPIGWWPPAPGWWLLGLLVCIAVVLLAQVLRRYFRKNRYRRAARRELERLYHACLARDDRRGFAAKANQLLRRAALARYPRAEVAALCQDDWLRFLERSANMPQFTATGGRMLVSAAYDPAADCDAAQLHALCRDWLRRHR